MNAQEKKKMQEPLKRSLENPQLVFLEQKEVS